MELFLAEESGFHKRPAYAREGTPDIIFEGIHEQNGSENQDYMQ